MSPQTNMTKTNDSSSSFIPTPTPKTNESDIAKRAFLGLIAGTMAGFSVAPFVTIIDKSIVQNASGASTMKASIRSSINDLIFRPHQFVRRYEFALIFGLYSATYQSANMIDTFYKANPHCFISLDFGKFIGVSAVNMTLCIYKDRCYARHFGICKPAPVPMRSLLLWGMRDLMTIVSSFNAPRHGSKYLNKRYNMNETKAFTLCQIISPIAIQIPSTFLHLTGLDMYNNPQQSMKQRIAFIQREYFKSLLARMARIFPAFSLGGIGNKFYFDYLYGTQ